MFNFVSLLKYKRQMAGNKLSKPAQRSIRLPGNVTLTSKNDRLLNVNVAFLGVMTP